jgi:ATP-dependent helicase YprA (DUF1998 family)
VAILPTASRYLLISSASSLLLSSALLYFSSNTDVGYIQTSPGLVWFVHDGIDGGIGFSKDIYEHFATLAERTREHIADCECGRRRGCPIYVMSEHCGNNNDPLDTLMGTMILEDVLEAVAAADSTPTYN